jgi:hypothetical protein
MPDKHSRPLRRKKPSAGAKAKRPEPPTYTVYVEDNFSAMARDTRWTLGTYATYESAVDAARQCVEDSLKNAWTAGMTAKGLRDHYTDFGDDPFIVPTPEGQRPFQARIYAADIAEDICRSLSAAEEPRGQD